VTMWHLRSEHSSICLDEHRLRMHANVNVVVVSADEGSLEEGDVDDKRA
jgi:hypothetical protein